MNEQAFYCPECGRRYQVDLERFDEQQLAILCGNCEAVFAPDEARVSDTPTELTAGQPSVLVAHESPSVCSTVGRVVREAGYVPRYVHNGAAAVAAFDRTMLDIPVALILDVGIPEMLAFDVVASLRRQIDHRELPIILLASVFDPTRYKRRPTSLHGADAYLELHHVPDRLPELLAARFAGSAPREGHRGHLPGEYARAEAIRQGSSIAGSDPARIEARRIVSDIALYHEAEILEGLNQGDLDARLAEVLAEGRRLFLESTRDLEGASVTAYDDAVRDMMESIRRRGVIES